MYAALRPGEMNVNNHQLRDVSVGLLSCSMCIMSRTVCVHVYECVFLIFTITSHLRHGGNAHDDAPDVTQSSPRSVCVYDDRLING